MPVDSVAPASAALVRKITRVLLGVFGFVGLIALFAYTLLENAYVTYPRIPDQASGRIVPNQVNGIVVYVTTGQSEVIHALVLTLLASGALIIVFIVLDRIVKREL